MGKIKYLFMAFGLFFGACSKSNKEPLDDIVSNDSNYGIYSVKIAFDDDSFDPEWLIDISGGTVQFEDKFDIEGLKFDAEIEKYSANNKTYNFLYESRENKAVKTLNFNFKQKTFGVSTIMTINKVEEINPSGKAEVFKDGKLVNSFDIGTQTFILYPYED